MSRATRGERAAERWDALASAAEALAVLLEAGVAPESAWLLVGEEASHPAVRRVSQRVVAGTPPGDALAELAGRPGGSGVAPLATRWLVATEAGASLAPALTGAAQSFRDRADALREVDVALSGPRATARTVGWLPPIGLGMAALLGVDVVGTLSGSATGWVLLLAGGALTVGGRLWTRGLVRRAARSTGDPGEPHELIAAGLSAGLSVSGAQELVASVRRRVGAPAMDDRGVERVLRLAERAGAPAGRLLASAAAQERRAARAADRRSASALGVRLMIPLAVCILPAFLALGVAPVVLALLSSTTATLR